MNILNDQLVKIDNSINSCKTLKDIVKLRTEFDNIRTEVFNAKLDPREIKILIDRCKVINQKMDSLAELFQKSLEEVKAAATLTPLEDAARLGRQMSLKTAAGNTNPVAFLPGEYTLSVEDFSKPEFAPFLDAAKRTENPLTISEAFNFLSKEICDDYQSFTADFNELKLNYLKGKSETDPLDPDELHKFVFKECNSRFRDFLLSRALPLLLYKRTKAKELFDSMVNKPAPSEMIWYSSDELSEKVLKILEVKVLSQFSKEERELEKAALFVVLTTLHREKGAYLRGAETERYLREVAEQVVATYLPFSSTPREEVDKLLESLMPVKEDLREFLNIRAIDVSNEQIKSVIELLPNYNKENVGVLKSYTKETAKEPGLIKWAKMTGFGDAVVDKEFVDGQFHSLHKKPALLSAYLKSVTES